MNLLDLFHMFSSIHTWLLIEGLRYEVQGTQWINSIEYFERGYASSLTRNFVVGKVSVRE